jgi:hypothetical protein
VSRTINLAVAAAEHDAGVTIIIEKLNKCAQWIINHEGVHQELLDAREPSVRTQGVIALGGVNRWYVRVSTGSYACLGGSSSL